MRCLTITLLALALGLAALARAADNTPPDGFTALFDGKAITEWEAKKPGWQEHWKVVDGVIQYDGQSADLWTKQPYQDFVLMVSWRLPKPGDSGIYVRGSSKCQANIWVSPLGSGEVYGYRTDTKMPELVRQAAKPKKKADKPVGAWNDFVITVKGTRMTVVLNEVVVIDALEMLGCPKEGPLALQHHGNPVEFKNIYIREFRPEVKPAPAGGKL